MKLSQLYYFKIVAEEEHISRAAERIHISQPSLSATIRRLETELGTPLFDRRGRNIFLNDEGKKLLEHVNFIFEQTFLLQKSFEQKDFHLAHGLSMGVNNNLFLDGWLSGFIKGNTSARITQELLAEDQMIQGLLDESLDLAIGIFPEIPSDIDHVQLLEDEYCVAVPHNHPLAQKDSLTFEDIRNEPFTAVSSKRVNSFIYPLFAQRDAKPNVIFEGNQTIMFKLLNEGRALLFSTRQLMYAQLLATENETVFSNAPLPSLMSVSDLDTTFSLSLCWKKGRALPSMAQKLKDSLINDYPLYSDDDTFMHALPHLVREEGCV